MKSYRNTDTGVFYRTLAEVKGMKFNPVEIPTSQQELIDFINDVIARSHPEMSASADNLPEREDLGSTDPDQGQIFPNGKIDPEDHFTRTFPELAREAAYRNGDPTTPYLKSRDPAARFTCTSCGASNVNHPET